jgi:hypothetical protein
VAAQPCLAAGLGGESGFGAGRVGAYAGASLAFPLGPGRHGAPTARLRLSPVSAYRDSRSGRLVERPAGAGVEIALTGAGKADLRIAGERPARIGERIGFKGSTGYIVVGGAVLLVLLLAAVANASPKPGPRPGDF